MAAVCLTALTFQTATAEVGVTASVSTIGLGLHASFPMAPAWHARFGVNGLSQSTEENTNDVDYDFKFKLAMVDALVDYFPMDGAFRVTGGVVYNGNKFDASGRPRGNASYTFNGNTYPVSVVGRLEAEVRFNKVAPYLGIGWGNPVAANKGWGFSSDVGVVFQGTPKSAVSNRGCTGNAALCNRIAADVRAEGQSLQAEMDDFKLLPVVRVGVSYKF